MRQPTEADLQKIHELLESAGGSRELIRWIKAAPRKSRKRGRPHGDKWEEIDYWLLQEVDIRHAAADRRKSVSLVISEVVDESRRAGASIGASPKAAQSRLFSRIRPEVIYVRGAKGTKSAKITLSKPQFEFPLTRYVQPRGEKRASTAINEFISGFRPPFSDLPSTIERPPSVYQPSSVEWQEQQDRVAQTQNNNGKTHEIE
jgi:hypothetical protein